MGHTNHVVVSVLCVVVTGSVGRGRRNDDRRVNGHCNNTLPREQQGLGLEDDAAMTG